jgi:protease-4
MKFLRNLLAVLVGLFIFSFLMLFIFVGIISISSAEKTISISDNSVLNLKLSGTIVEREVEDPFANIGFPGSGPREMGLKELKEAIRHAKTDEKIQGIFLEPRFFMAGIATLQELRGELADFRSSGKFILSYAEYYTEGAYYLCSVADEMYITPGYGMLEFNGLSAEYTFFSGLFEKVGIEPQIFRVGEYKSAVEPLVRKDLSEENKEQISVFMNHIYDYLLEDIAESRDMAIEEVRKISNSMLARSTEDAVELGLIDGEKYYNEILDILKEKLAIEEADEDVSMITYRKYNKSYSTGKYSKERIAVIIGEGSIIPGRADNQMIGSDTYAKLIKNARESDRVKAVVIRINSGGGNPLASDVIWKEIKLTAEKKPVVASIADVAASGGYYIVMACDKVYASPTSITGSIGIYGVLFNVEELFEDKLGITFDNISTGEYSDMYTMTRPLTPFEKDIIQKDVEKGYEIFTSKAAADRNMSIEDILKVASGRVYSGHEAIENGLIDEFGTLEDAIHSAAELAELDEYSVRYYPIQKTFFEQIMADLGNEVQTRYLKMKLGELYPYFEQIQELNTFKGIQTRMPYVLRFN